MVISSGGRQDSHTQKHVALSNIHLPARTDCADVADEPHSALLLYFQDVVLRIQEHLARTTPEHRQDSQLKVASPPFRQTALVVGAQCIRNL